MAQAASVAERRELDASPRAQTGVSLNDLSGCDVQRIARRRARGRRTSEEQYYAQPRVAFPTERPNVR